MSERAEHIRRGLLKLPGILAEHQPDVNGIGLEFRNTIANGILRLIQQDFRIKSRGGLGSDGIRWPRLAASTVARKAKSPRPPENLYMLAEFGDLYRSLTPGVGATLSGQPGQIVRFDKARGMIQVGTKIKPWHHRGAKRLPRRLLWSHPSRLTRAWREGLQRIIRDALRRAILRYIAEVILK